MWLALMNRSLPLSEETGWWQKATKRLKRHIGFLKTEANKYKVPPFPKKDHRAQAPFGVSFFFVLQ